MKWISPKDILPVSGKECLFCNGNEVFVGKYEENSPTIDENGVRNYRNYVVCIDDDRQVFIPIEDITHWIPFQKPPIKLD